MLARFVEALHIQEGDADVEAADIRLRIEDAGALEFAERRFELLAIHQRDAEIIFADDFGAGIGFFGGGLIVIFRGGWARERAVRGLLLLAGSGERTGEDRKEKEGAREAAHARPCSHRCMPDVFYRFASGLAATMPSFSFTVMI